MVTQALVPELLWVWVRSERDARYKGGIVSIRNVDGNPPSWASGKFLFIDNPFEPGAVRETVLGAEELDDIASCCLFRQARTLRMPGGPLMFTP